MCTYTGACQRKWGGGGGAGSPVLEQGASVPQHCQGRSSVWQLDEPWVPQQWLERDAPDWKPLCHPVRS